jgi:hypothetical protein
VGRTSSSLSSPTLRFSDEFSSSIKRRRRRKRCRGAYKEGRDAEKMEENDCCCLFLYIGRVLNSGVSLPFVVLCPLLQV